MPARHSAVGLCCARSILVFAPPPVVDLCCTRACVSVTGCGRARQRSSLTERFVRRLNLDELLLRVWRGVLVGVQLRGGARHKTASHWLGVRGGEERGRQRAGRGWVGAKHLRRQLPVLLLDSLERRVRRQVQRVKGLGLLVVLEALPAGSVTHTRGRPPARTLKKSLKTLWNPSRCISSQASPRSACSGTVPTVKRFFSTHVRTAHSGRTLRSRGTCLEVAPCLRAEHAVHVVLDLDGVAVVHGDLHVVVDTDGHGRRQQREHGPHVSNASAQAACDACLATGHAGPYLQQPRRLGGAGSNIWWRRCRYVATRHG
jgi:hypothetical protein